MGNRHALLIATYQYQDTGLKQLAAPGHDAEALAEVLKDKKIAGFHVSTLINKPHHEVGMAIGEFFRDKRKDDLTLLYFTGHGLKDDDGALYLATTNTQRDSLLFTSLPAEQIDRAMSSCASSQQVLILDCCYSGAFPAGRMAKSDDSVQALERFQGRGRTILTASDATQYSFEGDKISGTGTQSVFTRYLVEGLREGSADLDQDGDITLDELYGYVHDRVVAEMPRQRPKRLDNVAGRTLIARNVNWTLSPHLRSLINSPVPSDRASALDSLAQLYRMGNHHVRAAVIAQIRGLAQDDSKTVSLAAAERLTVLTTEPQERQALPVTSVPTQDVPRKRWRRRRRTVIAGSALGAAAIVLGALAPQLWPADPPPQPPPAVVPITSDQDLPHAGMAVNRDWTRLYVTNFATRTVSVIDPRRTAVIGTPIAVGRRPAGLAVAADGRKVYVANSDDSTLTAITVETGDTSVVKVPRGPFGVATALDRPYVYVTSFDASKMSVIDAVDGATVGDPMQLRGHPMGLALHPHGHRIYVVNDSGTLSVIDNATSEVEEIDLGGYPYAVVTGPQGVHVHAVLIKPNRLVTVDTATNKTVGAPVPLAPGPFGIAAGGNNLVHVSSFDSATLTTIDTTTGLPVGEPIKLPISPRGVVAVDRQAHRLFVSDGAGALCVVDTQARSVSDPITIP